MISAFGVEHGGVIIDLNKSEYAPGKYAPATSLTTAQRKKVVRTSNRRTPFGAKHPQGARGTSAVYRRHVFGMSHRGPAATMAESTTPSAVHPKIEYGSSIPAKHHAAIDALIDPKIAAKSPHPIVVHRGTFTHPQIHGAAIGAHTSSGGKGHVQLGSDSIDASGKVNHEMGFPRRVNGSNILNHELAHASVKQSNPRKFFTRGRADAGRRAMGEEGRADALSQKGRGLYQRSGSISSKKDVHLAAIATPASIHAQLKEAGAEGLYREDQIKGLARNARTAAKGESHYLGVRDAVRAARFIHKSEEGLMISAFGIDHGDISKSKENAKKGAKYGALGGAAAAATDMGINAPPANKFLKTRLKMKGGSRAAVLGSVAAGTAGAYTAAGAAGGAAGGSLLGNKKKRISNGN